MNGQEGSRNGVMWFCWNTLLKVQRLVMLVALVLTTLAICAEVVSRYILGSSIVGIEELGAYIAFWIYFIGAAYGTYSRSHITAELTHLILRNPAHMAIVKLSTNFISFALLAYIIPWGWRFVEWGYSHNEQSAATFLGSTYPIVFFQVAIFIGIILMAFYFLIETIGWFRVVFLGGAASHDSLMSEREELETWI